MMNFKCRLRWIYSSVLSKMKREAADRVGNLLAPLMKKTPDNLIRETKPGSYELPGFCLSVYKVCT
jgi:hypothetical protein